MRFGVSPSGWCKRLWRMPAARWALLAAACLAGTPGCMTTRSGSPLEGFGTDPASLADEPRRPRFSDAEVDADGTMYYSPGSGGARASGSTSGTGSGRMSRADSVPSGGGSAGASVLRVGDFVQVQLKGVPQTEEAMLDFSLNDQATIAMPHLPPIRAVGKAPGLLEREIEEMYKSQRIFTNPKVSVLVGGRYINVMGEVRMPQRVLYTSDLTVLRAVAASGGFTDYANKRAVRIHRGDEIIEVHAARALKDPREDVPLRPGDTVEVRRSIF